MKNVLVLLLFAFAVVVTGCNKESAVPNKENLSDRSTSEITTLNNADDPVSEDDMWDSTDVEYLYFLDGEQVDEGAFDPGGEGIYLGITGDQIGDDMVVSLNAFTSEMGYIQWGEANGFEVALSLEIENHLRDYAEENGVIEIYEETGEVPDFYTEYANAYYEEMMGSLGFNNIETRFLTFVYHDFLRDGNSFFLFPGGQFVMWPGFNNRVSSVLYSIIGGGMTVFDRSFFRNRLGTIWRWGWSTVNFWGALRGFNDRMSSVSIIGI